MVKWGLAGWLAAICGISDRGFFVGGKCDGAVGCEDAAGRGCDGSGGGRELSNGGGGFGFFASEHAGFDQAWRGQREGRFA